MSAPVTEAHRAITESVFELLDSVEMVGPSPAERAAQLIADSEAKATAQLRADRDYNHECINRLASATGTLGEKSERVVEVALSTIDQLRAERDALLEIAWLDTPDEPHKNVGQWRVEFCNGWERRSVYDQLRAEVERLKEAHHLADGTANLALVHRDAAEARAERAEADTYRIKLAAIGAIEAASKYSATGNYEEADLVRQDFADKETIEVFEKFRARANRTEKAEAELAKERARLDWLEKVDPTSPQWDIICDHVNIRDAIDAAMKEDRT